MAGFVDVLLRGAILGLLSLVVGGMAWLLGVLRAQPHVKPTAATALALRVVAGGAGLAAAAQLMVAVVSLAALADDQGGWPVGLFLQTTFARSALVRAALAAGVGGLAFVLARRPAGWAAWSGLAGGVLVLIASSAAMSHAMARPGERALLLVLDAFHQLAAATWVGGLAHLTIHAWWRQRPDHPPEADAGPAPAVVIRRFSALALTSVIALVVAGTALAWLYVGDAAALIGTAYGVMILSKGALLAAVLGLAAANFRFVRRAAGGPDARLLRFVEVELGLGLTLMFAAASLTSLPPSVDVTVDRATVAEVAARFRPAPPRLTSPPLDELIRTADPLMAPAGERKPIERAWSEYNHHWAGFFVLVMGLLAALERRGVRAARHWPLGFLGLAVFLFLRNDPRAWPLGPAGFWESLTLPDVLQHRLFTVLIVAFAVFEWMVRTRRLPDRPWGYVFPLLCAVGGGLLLTHSHAMFNLKEEFLTEVTHAPLGILGAFAGWARWLEVRLPGVGRGPGWLWTGCFIAVGLLLLVYREG